MPIIYRRYGDIVEITEYEKDINKRKTRSSRVNVLSTIEGLPCFRKRRPDSIRRAKKICLRRVSSAIKEFGSPLFITLTFNGDATNVSFANKALRNFQERLRVECNGAVSIFVPELSPRGRIHFHGLLFRLPLEWGDKRIGGKLLEYGTERKTRFLASLWKEGFVDVKQTDGSPKLAYYLTKYIMKSGEDVLFNSIRLIRVSRGFPKEMVFTGDIAYFIAQQYENKLESFGWTGYNTFLGYINKKVYWLN